MLLIRSLNSVAIVLVDVGGITVMLASRGAGGAVLCTNNTGCSAQKLSNLCAELYPSDLPRAAELAEEGVTTSKRVGDAYYTEVVLTNA